jgi:hypothetical protein
MRPNPKGFGLFEHLVAIDHFYDLLLTNFYENEQHGTKCKADVGQYLKIESLQGGEIIGDVGMC